MKSAAPYNVAERLAGLIDTLPSGLTLANLNRRFSMGYRHEARRILEQWVVEGRAHKVVLARPSMRPGSPICHAFGCPRRAAAFLASATRAIAAERQAHAAAVARAAAPRRAPAASGAPPQVLPGYTHNRRVQCAPGEQPFGAGFVAVGVGRDVRTGQEWA